MGQELAAFDAEVEREMEAARVNGTTQPPSAPPPLTQPDIRTRIKLGQRWPKLWAKSYDGEDFRANLIARLLAALELARRSHADEDVTAIQAELRALDATAVMPVRVCNIVSPCPCV